jgi:hypothetical protein
MKSMMILALVGALFTPASSRAHEAGLHARGTIEEITPHRVVVATKDGKDQTYALDADTKFLRGEAPARREDVRAGERAVVHARRDGGELHATEVRLAPARAGSKEGAKP